MNKHKNIISNAASALLALAAFSMTFTSCSGDDEPMQDASGKSVEITVGVTSGNSIDTRTNLEEGDDRMACTWAENDKLLVTDTSGEILSTLSITEGVGKKTATFTGTLSGMADGTVKLNFTYLGASTKLGNVTESTFNVNLAQQDGLQTTLKDYDIMSAQANVIISGGSASIASGITLNKLLAIGHFTLKFPEGVSITDRTVVISGDNLKNATVVNLFNGSTSGSADGNITIERSDFYLNLIPATDVAPKFTVTTEDGVEYEGTLAVKDIKAGDFICGGNKVGVSVEMRTNEVIDHSKNPLKKWAEANLARQDGTVGANAENVFASSYKETGSYYQFGRNHGFSSYTDAKTNVGVEKGPSVGTNRSCYDGTRNAKVVPWYESSSTVSKYPQHFFIDANDGGDYVSPSKTQDWSARAKSCGYNSTNPSPKGWRLPTLNDYEEILPTGGIKSLLTTFSEIKSLSDGTKYAIQWNRVVDNSVNYMQIHCLVVSSDVTETSSIDWNNANVVTRYFKASGCIQASYYLWSLSGGGGTQYIATPLPLCAYTASAVNVGGGATVVYAITRNDNALGGYYWASDAAQYTMTFMFDPNNYQEGGSYINVFGQTNPNAYNIRCVKDE